jgi:predicted transcriptional regulator
MRELRNAGGAGLGRQEINDLLGRSVNATRVSVALDMLQKQGLIFSQKIITGGRPREQWYIR